MYSVEDGKDRKAGGEAGNNLWQKEYHSLLETYHLSKNVGKTVLEHFKVYTMIIAETNNSL